MNHSEQKFLFSFWLKSATGKATELDNRTN
jgi:hypothetical protein